MKNYYLKFNYQSDPRSRSKVRSILKGLNIEAMQFAPSEIDVGLDYPWYSNIQSHTKPNASGGSYVFRGCFNQPWWFLTARAATSSVD